MPVVRSVPDVGGRNTNPNMDEAIEAGHCSPELNFFKPGFDKNQETDFRAHTTGEPRLSYLRSSPPRAPVITRRSTLSDIPEIDHCLVAHRVQYNGVEYLSLTIGAIHVLTPFINGAKPVADLTVFKNLAVDQEMRVIHCDALTLALASIGNHCTGSLLITGANLQNLAAVGRDWAQVLHLLPKVNSITFQA